MLSLLLLLCSILYGCDVKLVLASIFIFYTIQCSVVFYKYYLFCFVKYINVVNYFSSFTYFDKVFSWRQGPYKYVNNICALIDGFQHEFRIFNFVTNPSDLLVLLYRQILNLMRCCQFKISLQNGVVKVWVLRYTTYVCVRVAGVPTMSVQTEIKLRRYVAIVTTLYLPSPSDQ